MWINDDAVDRADRRKTLSAARAQLGNDHHVDTEIENRTELRRAMAKAGITIDADSHVDT